MACLHGVVSGQCNDCLAEQLATEAEILADLRNRQKKEDHEPRRCVWCDDVLELNDDLLCGACSYKRAFLED